MLGENPSLGRKRGRRVHETTLLGKRLQPCLFPSALDVAFLAKRLPLQDLGDADGVTQPPTDRVGVHSLGLEQRLEHGRKNATCAALLSNILTPTP
jgi:hypothetical protein